MKRLSQLLCIASIFVWVFIHGEGHSQNQGWSKQFPSAAKTIGINPLNSNSICAEGDSGKLYVSYNRGSTWSFAGATGIVYGIRQILRSIACAGSTPTWL